jgi:hypothetical protein
LAWSTSVTLLLPNTAFLKLADMEVALPPYVEERLPIPLDELQVEGVMGAVERTTDQLERGLPAEDACLGLAGCDNGATILIQGSLA